MPRAIDLTGQRFGRLLVLRRADLPSGKGRWWVCRCDCGGEITALVRKLRSDHVRSCGCLNRDQASSLGRSSVRHGLTNSPTYRSWLRMRERCENKNHVHYANYGGRGILVCSRWAEFDAFLADMGIRPKGLTLDRINNDGNYEPSNCRWADRATQLQNRRPRSRRRAKEAVTVLL